MIRDFDELEVYKLSLDLANWIYDITEKFPSDEKFGMISQLRRAGASIGANIAEGFGRFHYRENQQFCRQARGSLTETRHFLLLGNSRGLVSKESLEQFNSKYTVLKIKLNNYINSIGAKGSS